jgi:hypothetical protein
MVGFDILRSLAVLDGSSTRRGVNEKMWPMGRALALLAVVAGCGVNYIPGTSVENDMASPRDLLTVPDVAPAPDLLTVDGGADLARADLARAADLLTLPDLTPAVDGAMMCRERSAPCSTGDQCCSGRCEIVLANPLECCALAGERCTDPAANCCPSTGGSCYRNSTIGINDFVCCVLSTRQCPADVLKRQATANCGTGVIPYGDCFT